MVPLFTWRYNFQNNNNDAPPELDWASTPNKGEQPKEQKKDPLVQHPTKDAPVCDSYFDWAI